MKKSTLEHLHCCFWALLSHDWVYIPAVSIGKSSSFNDISVANFGGLVSLKGNDEVNWMRFSLILVTSDQTNGLAKLLSSCNHSVLIHMMIELAFDNVKRSVISTESSGFDVSTSVRNLNALNSLSGLWRERGTSGVLWIPPASKPLEVCFSLFKTHVKWIVVDNINGTVCTPLLRSCMKWKKPQAQSNQCLVVLLYVVGSLI